MNKLRIALVGNPNCGKSTLFNNLTGLRHHTGNWSGKVVEREAGKVTYKDYTFDITDLPGSYSLSSRTFNEKFAADFLLQEKPDAVINIVDASHLEKNLFLTLQLAEIGIPVIVALNMSRFAEKDGIFVDDRRLGEMLGLPVVRIEAVSKKARTVIFDEVIHIHEHALDTHGEYVHTHVHKDNHEVIVDNETTHLHGPSDAQPHTHTLTHSHAKTIHYYDESLEFHIADLSAEGMTRWEALETLIHQTLDEETHTFVTRRHLEEEYGGLSLTEIISSQKYRYIAEIIRASVTVKGTVRERVTQAIDSVVMNRILAIPIFLAVMFVIFQIVFVVGSPIQGLLAEFFTWLGTVVTAPLADARAWISSPLLLQLITNLMQ
ncbi:MAG TPA: 50S ribosome-binding GTPase, partial [Methanocorpusculum sp.]|nr:50S ribosome-binding GTPase [Methanocorpusculum sp.]